MASWVAERATGEVPAPLGVWLPLIRSLEAACVGPAECVPVAAAAALAQDLPADHQLPWSAWSPGESGYRRHVVYADPLGRFAVVALVWSPGQCTPIHGHYTWCAYQVVAGELHEEGYQRVPDSLHVRLVGTVRRPEGSQGLGHAGLETVHRLRHAAGQPAVSVHVYGIDGGRVATHVNRLVEVVG